jgi:3-hydroxybutyrate dehydrogenase
MALQVLGKTALITGAGSGICLEFARLLLRNSCNVLIADQVLTPEAEILIQENSSKDEGKARAVFKNTDVTNWSHLREAFEASLIEFGALDIVCPGAGVFEPVHPFTKCLNSQINVHVLILCSYHV